MSIRTRRLIHVPLLVSGLLSSSAMGQDTMAYRGFYLGVGCGLDAGGVIGARATYWVAPFLACFAGGGWAFIDPAYNLGVEVRFHSSTRASFFLTGMHGNNAVIVVRGNDALSKIYHGTTAGMGVMLKQRHLRNYWRFSLNIPFRSDEFNDDWARLERRGDLRVFSEPLPFTVGVGFNLAL